jgi:hypothetical protein
MYISIGQIRTLLVSLVEASSDQDIKRIEALYERIVIRLDHIESEASRIEIEGLAISPQKNVNKVGG